MRKVKQTILIMMAIAASGSIWLTHAQSPEKRQLILDFRTSTGAHNVTGSINFPPDGIRAILWTIVSDDKELTDAQKQTLRQPVEEATVRVHKPIREFLSDATQMAPLQEEVILRIYDTTFNEAELKEMIAFFQTPTGQKAAAFLPGLNRRVESEFGPVVQKKVQEMLGPRLQAEREQLTQRIKDLKKGSD